MSKTTQYAPRTTHHASRLWPTLRLSLTPNHFISLLLFITGLTAYTLTLAPSVLEGDGALFQYTPYVLGVTYPTGFPLYILIGKLWLTLFPVGDIAWRMNFLSALCSATALPLIYNAARHLYADSPARSETTGPRWAALIATLTFATLPTFWLWSTVTKTYALNILLFSWLLYLLARTLEQAGERSPKCTLDSSPLRWPALLLGLQISVHNTAVLLLPGLLLFVWLNFRRYLTTWKARLLHLGLLAAPGLFYLYIPLRGQWLIARYGREEAIARGLLADFYQPGWAGLLRYFTAADFTGGVATNWGQVPGQFFSRYLPILLDNLPLAVVIIGFIGLILALVRQPRRFLPLFLIYALPIPFVLAYGQGEQSAFLLPSFLIFSLFIGYTIKITNPQGKRYQLSITNYQLPITNLQSLISLSLFLLFTLFLFLPRARDNTNWLEAKWSRPTHAEWTDNLNHPLEPGATILAPWGDLTSFWYMQYAEQRRPDLRGLYPATEAVVSDWYERGGQNLYIAGPLENWAEGVEERYQLLPWGRLVRIAPRDLDPQRLLPDLPYQPDAIFAGQLHLLGADFAPQVSDGSLYPVTLTWQALAGLPPETTFSLRLSRGETIVAQIDDTLLSGWFPRDSLPPGQYLLNYPLLPIPLGTLPGSYRLQLVTYTSYKQPWPLPDGATLLDLGQVEIILPPPDFQPDDSAFETVAGHDFNGEIRLADYDYSVHRVGQGKGFAVKLLWRAITTPVDNYTLLVEAVDAGGKVVRAVERTPVGGQAPPATWQPGQFIRDQVDLVLPASAPVGPNTLRVRLSWLRPDGSKLTVRRWGISWGDSLTLAGLEVTEKEDRVFEMPAVDHPLDANLDNKARLLGYNVSLGESRLKSGLQLSQTDCAHSPAPCQLSFEFIWQGLSEMDQLYFAFLHLVDAEGHIVAQQDKAPGLRGKQPTTGWLPHEIITDPIELPLPPELPPGDYTLRLGMYLPPEGPRLVMVDEAGQPVGDFIEVGTITVKP